MRTEVISDEATMLIRRMVLEPGQATPWHVDRCRRFTVVVRGDRLRIEYRGSTEPVTVPVEPGQAEWDDPDPVVHRAVNCGVETFEEVVTFHRSQPGQDPQPPG